MTYDADVAVIGLGAFGSSALWRLAVRGIDVIGFEQFDLANDSGSSHGRTRLFRTISHDIPELYPLSMLSRELWTELDEISTEQVFRASGGVLVGHPGGRIEQYVTAIEWNFDLQVPRLSPPELRDRHHAFSAVDPQARCFVDEDAGVLFPEAAIRAACNAARDLGARVLENTAITSMETDANGVRLETSGQHYRVKHVIVCSGAWSSKFLPELPLHVERIPQTWLAWKSGGSPQLSELPVFQFELPSGSALWGHGAVTDGARAKIGTSGNPRMNRTANIEAIDRTVHSEDLDYLRELAAEAFPEISVEPVESSICVLATPPDSQFYVGPTSNPRVLAGFGGAGKGFKHAAAVGEILSRYIAGENMPFDTGFMSPCRFSGAAGTDAEHTQGKSRAESPGRTT